MNRKDLAAAFETWAKRYNRNPKSFNEDGHKTPKPYGESCANYLIKLVSERAARRQARKA